MKTIKILAQIELFSGKDMRTTPFFSKYRPVFDFVGAKSKTSGSIDLIDMEKFSPGMSGKVHISFMEEGIAKNHLKKGEQFTFSEGGPALGKGEILQVLE